MAPPAFKTEFFISRRGPMSAVAQEVADTLQNAGHTTRIQNYDFKLGGDFVEDIGNALRECRHLIVIHSADYWANDHTRKEFTNFSAQVAKSAGDRRIIVLRCDPAEPDGLMSAIVYGDLHTTTDPAERKRIILAAARGQSTAERLVRAESNISIRIPTHFLGRDADLAGLHTALHRAEGRLAITALHGLRGVGKTVLAAAYARTHAPAYRVTWWIAAQTESTLRADLASLGIRLGWVPADTPQDAAIAETLARLAQPGENILLIYDNAIDARSISRYLPRGGPAHIIITSNDPAWRGLASPLEIRLWTPSIGADFLIARTGRTTERESAEALSKTLGGLPLAHEMAAAYCEQIGIPLADYAARFTATPEALLDDADVAPTEFHDGLTTAKAFTIAIEQAARRHPAAEPLLTCAALLAPEPIPLFLFAEGRPHLGEPLVTLLAGTGLDEAVATLRAFALLDREQIPDERDPTITTDSIRLHRLVRQVAASRPTETARKKISATLIEATNLVYPSAVYNSPSTWPRARMLDSLALALVGEATSLPPDAQLAAASLLNRLQAFHDSARADYAQARILSERSLAIREKILGPDHPSTATSLNNLAVLLQTQGNLAGARPLVERALTIREMALGADHPDTATSLNNLARLLQSQGDLAAARPLFERALAIHENVLGPDHPDTANSLDNLASLKQAQGDLSAARTLFERALAIREKALGPDHPDTATSLDNLADLLRNQSDRAGSRPRPTSEQTTRETTSDPNHRTTEAVLNRPATPPEDQRQVADAINGEISVPKESGPSIDQSVVPGRAVTPLIANTANLPGSPWIAKADHFTLHTSPSQDDTSAAANDFNRSLHTDAQQKSAALLAPAYRLHNQPGWSSLAAAARLHAALARDCTEMPTCLAPAYTALLTLGAVLEKDNAVRRGEDSAATPLDADAREALSSLIRTAAPYLRVYPTIRALDDAAGAFLARPDLFAPARDIIMHARDNELIARPMPTQRWTRWTFLMRRDRSLTKLVPMPLEPPAIWSSPARYNSR